MFDRMDEASLRRAAVSRRRVLQAGSLGLAGLGLSLPALLANESSQEQNRLKPLADNCILLFLNGGPSHLDMWDMKPNAPDGIRGEFQLQQFLAATVLTGAFSRGGQRGGHAHSGRDRG